jgi:hypothetical protein
MAKAKPTFKKVITTYVLYVCTYVYVHMYIYVGMPERILGITYQNGKIAIKHTK